MKANDVILTSKGNYGDKSWGNTPFQKWGIVDIEKGFTKCTFTKPEEFSSHS